MWRKEHSPCQGNLQQCLSQPLWKLQVHSAVLWKSWSQNSSLPVSRPMVFSLLIPRAIAFGMQSLLGKNKSDKWLCDCIFFSLNFCFSFYLIYLWWWKGFKLQCKVLTFSLKSWAKLTAEIRVLLWFLTIEKQMNSALKRKTTSYLLDDSVTSHKR